MQGGTISDEYPGKPKALFVFEGLLAICHSPKIEARAVRWGVWKRALDMWDWSVPAIQTLRHFNDRHEKNFDVVTWHPAAFAELLADRMDDMGMRPQKVFADRYAFLQMDVAMSPDYDVVFDPDPHHSHGYGFKARTATYADFNTNVRL